MKKLWIWVDGLRIKIVLKEKLFLSLLIIVNLAAGAILWLIVGRLFLPGIDWLICFMGYPAVFIGLFGGQLYLMTHKFS